MFVLRRAQTHSTTCNPTEPTSEASHIRELGSCPVDPASLVPDPPNIYQPLHLLCLTRLPLLSTSSIQSLTPGQHQPGTDTVLLSAPARLHHSHICETGEPPPCRSTRTFSKRGGIPIRGNRSRARWFVPCRPDHVFKTSMLIFLQKSLVGRGEDVRHLLEASNTPH